MQYDENKQNKHAKLSDSPLDGIRRGVFDRSVTVRLGFFFTRSGSSVMSLSSNTIGCLLQLPTMTA